ncbi:MAG: hypothetical protein ACTTIC_07430 [Helicobacteraceae bacterium]
MKTSKIITQVKGRKEEILKERSDTFATTNYENLRKYQEALEDHIKTKMQKIKDTDIDEIKR